MGMLSEVPLSARQPEPEEIEKDGLVHTEGKDRPSRQVRLRCEATRISLVTHFERD